ncbi:MAG: L-threonylcarbamoyladenylate synthase [Actinomycetaceae bacterium]|nr:L-threonylcarbamoyladenylate synthase [Actinomycetaceae bacterium]MDY6083329.1 L-threonylcarbamoyladenylate synthase [Actinomycetaceae bacterium]
MARYIEIHPVNPQPRLVTKVVQDLRAGAVIAMPTDSGYALACAMANKAGLERIRTIRHVGAKHHFTLLCHDFAQIGQLAIVDNTQFRLIKALTPGSYTFILKGTKEVPRMTMTASKTIGIRMPDHVLTQAIVEAMGAAVISSSLILPGQTEPMTQGWDVNEVLGSQLDVVVEGPAGAEGPTTVIDLSEGEVEIVRRGAGDISML